MKTSSIVWMVVAVFVIGGAIIFYGWGNSGSQPPVIQYQSGTPATQYKPKQIVPNATNPVGAPIETPPQSAPVPPAPAAKSFNINANDLGADITSITVSVGTPVSITFSADAENTYHGGLDFRSLIVNTGTVAPGDSKTISFTATKSFSFTPYWPSTNVAKPYTIRVIVQ